MVRIKTGVLGLPRGGQIFASDGSFRKNPDRGDRFPGGWGMPRLTALIPWEIHRRLFRAIPDL